MDAPVNFEADNPQSLPTVAPETPCEFFDMAAPLHLQRLDSALDMRPFMEYAREILAQPLSSDDSECSNDCKMPRLLETKEERQNVKMHIFNLSDLTADREWLMNKVILSDTETETDISDEDEYIKELLKEYVQEQKHRESFYKKPTNTQYGYYAAGLLSNYDMYPEHQQSIVGVRKRKRRTKKELQHKVQKLEKPTTKVRKSRKTDNYVREPGEIHPSELKNYAFGDTTAVDDDDEDDIDINNDGDDDDVADDGELTDEMDVNANASLNEQTLNASGSNNRRRSRKGKHIRSPEVMAARRRRVWQLMVKKEIGRCQRSKMNNHKEVIQNSKRVATMCMKVVRQRAMQSQKATKEVVWRAKRLTREMLSYWKRYERIERDYKRRMEREAEEQRKIDVEIIEAKRQQRKLNFLITQTELYAHFMSKKLGHGTEEEQLRILNQLDEETNPRLAVYDNYDANEMKLLAQKNAENAFNADCNKKIQFDANGKEITIKAEDDENEIENKSENENETENETENEIPKEEAVNEESIKVEKKDVDLPQPNIFNGTLKAYQIKGMTWLANLYDQGISGILADEMGLGKTVQSIAFLCHIAERYGVWGPFLIISPASTLHNWQQEMARFVPVFNVVPYWGSPNERKILRQFWEQKDLHTREASFHVVITSYQLIVSDYKYFNRIKWQYMVLDEAQAIKSATSMRWKLLLGFNCRNRLLLSGTPIQNSMAELWALLHFIMPTLFDSHDEFNEWFSKDIESHAENKTGIDEKHLSRLHMILKPFMLRRIKKDVENELSDKIEIMVYCPLTIRQKLLYMALKKKIRIEDLLHLTGVGVGGSSADGQHVDRNFTSNLMNLVMQFRKVCNHPELFERRDAKSPFSMRCAEYICPRLIYDEAMLHRAIPSKKHLLYNRFSIFKSAYIYNTLFGESKQKQQTNKSTNSIDLQKTNDCCFSFIRFLNLSIKDLEDLTSNGLITFFQCYRRILESYNLLAYHHDWCSHYQSTRYQLFEPLFEQALLKCLYLTESILKKFIFTGMTSNNSTIYAFGNYKTECMQETVEHRFIRSKNISSNSNVLIEELDQDQTDIKPNIDFSDDFLQETSTSNKLSSNHKTKTNQTWLLPRFPHIQRPATNYTCEPLPIPRFLYGLSQRVQAVKRRLYCDSRMAEWDFIRHSHCDNKEGLGLVANGLQLCKPRYGWSSITIPDKQTLVSDAGKLAVLDSLLTRLKAQGHRVLIYSQMTKMIDLLEEYMWHRKHRYMRLDGSSKISARRDMVADFQTRADIFVFLLSTRAGGLGINLTAADTVIFYDSDWNPTVDQQAMDRAHRLGQTKQVTVYRLICKGTIEERILQRAREKSEIQRMVISGGNFKPDTLKPKEVVSLLLDDEEIKQKYRQKLEPNVLSNEKKKRSQTQSTNPDSSITSKTDLPTNVKRTKTETQTDDDSMAGTSSRSSPSFAASSSNAFSLNDTFVPGATNVMQNNDDEDNDNETLIVDCESPTMSSESPSLFGDFSSIGSIRRRHHPRGTKRGRPRGSTRRGGGNGSILKDDASIVIGTFTTTNAEEDLEKVKRLHQQNNENSFITTIPTPIKRGPGRPRLKTVGPISRGIRGSNRTRKPIGPLVVPLGKSPVSTPINQSPAISRATTPT